MMVTAALLCVICQMPSVFLLPLIAVVNVFCFIVTIEKLAC